MFDPRVLYDPQYNLLGVEAVITSDAGAVLATVTAIDKTAGVDVADRNNRGGRSIEFLSVGTIRPAADVRAYELAEKSLAPSDLINAFITLNGTTWRIKSREPRPCPAGEGNGEIRLLLGEERSSSS